MIRTNQRVVCLFVSTTYLTSLIFSSAAEAQSAMEKRFTAIHSRFLGIQTAVNPDVNRHPTTRHPRSYHRRRPMVLASSGRYKHRLHWLSPAGLNSFTETYGWTRQKFTAKKVGRLNYDPVLVGAQNLDQNNVLYQVQATALEVAQDTPTVTDEESTKEQNLLVVVALEYIKQGKADLAVEVLKQAIHHPDDGDTARDLLSQVQSVQSDAQRTVQGNTSATGTISLDADDEDAVVILDGERADARVPCSLMTSAGRHTVEVYEPGGKTIRFVAQVRSFSRTAVDLNFAEGTWKVDGGGNTWYAINSCILSTDESHVFTLRDLDQGPLEIIVYKPRNATCVWYIATENNSWSRTFVSPGENDFNLSVSTTLKLRVTCRSGGGQFYVVIGKGYFPKYRGEESPLSIFYRDHTTE